MKTYLKTLLAVLLAVVCIFMCVSCEDLLGSLTGNGGSGTGEGGGETGGETGGENTEDEIDYENSYRIKLVYSYAAIVENSAGRKEYTQSEKTVANIYVPHENNGFDDAIKAQIAGVTYHGYSFVKWYSEWDTESQTGVTEFVYPTGPITGDITIYGDRGDLAGANVTWAVETVYDEAEEGKEPSVRDVILTFSGTGPMFDFAYSNAVDIPWYDYLGSVTKVVFEEGITTVGANTLNGFKRLRNVEFSNTIHTIGKSAFAYCANSSFRTITFPESLKTISANAFMGAEHLREVYLNDGLEFIGDSAFYGARRIRSIVVPASLTTIETGAFHPGMKTSSGLNDHALKKVYYKGTAAQFAAIKINIDNSWFKELATLYEYYETPKVNGIPDESAYPSGSYWHYAVDADNNDTTVPVQYCYAIKYIPESGSNIPFAIHYLPATPKIVVDEQTGEESFEYDNNGIIVLEGVMTEELVVAREELRYHGYKFASFAGALAAGDVITDDKDCTGVRGNILNADGGVIWQLSSDNTTLTISLSEEAKNGNASKEIWDVSTSHDTTTLYTKISNIKTINIEDGVEYLGSFALSGFTGVQSIIMPASIKGVHEYAFDGSSNLLYIYYKSADGTSVADAEQCKLYRTTSGSRVELDANITKGLSGVRTTVYNEIFESTSELGAYWMVIDGKTIAWTLSSAGDGKTAITVGGDNEMIDFSSASNAPWYGAKSSIASVSIVRNITSLGKNIFKNYSNVAEISLPEGLRVIPSTAFSGTGIVKNTAGYTNGLLVVDGHLLAVDESRDAELFETQIGMITIANGAFDDCPSIKTLYIASTIQYINSNRLSGVETVYTESAVEAWDYISRSAGFSAEMKVYFKSDEEPVERMSFNVGEDPDEINKTKWWHKVDSEYVVWGCQHEFTEWEYKYVMYSDGPYYYYPTCSAEGIMVRHCIYDESHVQELKIAKDPDAHNLGVYVSNNNGTCSSNCTETAHCTGFGCPYTETREIPDSKNPNVHTYGDPVDNGDGTETYTCTGCGHIDTKAKEE